MASASSQHGTRVLRERLLDQTRPKSAELIRDTLRCYARQKVNQAFPAGEQQPQGFGIERIVFTYLDYLLATGADPDIIAADPKFTFTYRNSIEHFFPQYPDREQEGWNCVTAERPELNMLGNLALISVGANSKFSNNLPEIKVAKFKETIRQSPKLRLMAMHVKDGGVWDRKAIRGHDDAMVELLRKDIETETTSSEDGNDRAHLHGNTLTAPDTA